MPYIRNKDLKQLLQVYFIEGFNTGYCIEDTDNEIDYKRRIQEFEEFYNYNKDYIINELKEGI